MADFTSSLSSSQIEQVLRRNSEASVTHYGATSGSNIASALSQAVTYCLANGLASVYVPLASVSVGSSVDMQGIGITGEGTTIADTANLQNIGPLKGCIVRGFPTDADYRGSLATGAAHPKAVFRQTADRISVFMKRCGKGYINSEHWYDSFLSGASDAGGACQRWRQCVTRLASAVYVYKHNADDETAAAWGASSEAVFSQTFPAGTSDGERLKFRTTNTLNAEIAWNVEASQIGQRGSVCLYSTGGSANGVELYVNGTLQRTFSATLVGTNYLMQVAYELDLVGTNEVRLKKVSTGSLNVIGAEFSELKDYQDGRAVDSLAYGNWGEDYVPGNGAGDFALRSVAEAKFFGSVHGGETERLASKLFVDGTETTIPANIGDFALGKNIRWESFTTIAVGADSLDVDMSYTYSQDSYLKQDVSMAGSATVDVAYTAMNSASDEFSVVGFPQYQTISAGKNLIGRYDTVTQINRSNANLPMQMTTRFTLFPMGGETGANMGANGPYITGAAGVFNKLYYGPVLDSDTTLTSLAFSAEKVFE